jgi:hypothetical protein
MAVATSANVTLYGFYDDLNVVGQPIEVLRALSALQTLLPAVSLRCNTAKSHFAYFHDESAPLTRSARRQLADFDIKLHEDWLEVMGAIVGRDEQAIRAGSAVVSGPIMETMPSSAVCNSTSCQCRVPCCCCIVAQYRR